MSNLTHKNYKFYKEFFQNRFYTSSNEIQKSFLEIEPEDFLQQLKTNKKYFCNNKVEIFEHFHKTKEEYFRFKEEEKFYKYFKRFFISLPREIKEELIDYGFEKFKNGLEKYSLPNKDLERNFDFIKNPDLIYIYNEEEKFKKKYGLRFNNFHFKNRLPFHIFGFERFSSVENKKGNLVETFLENKKPIIEPIDKNTEVEILYFKEKPKTNNYIQINQITEKTKSVQINNQIKWRNGELKEKIGMRQCKIKPIEVSEFSMFVEEYDFHGKTYGTGKTEYYGVFHKGKIVGVFGFVDNRLLRIATRNVRIVGLLSKVLSFKENVEVSLDEQFYTGRSLEKLGYKIKSRNSAVTYYLTDLGEFSSNKRFLKGNIIESYLKPGNLIFERSEKGFGNIKSDVRFSTFYGGRYFCLTEEQKQELNEIGFEEVNKVLEKTKNWDLNIYNIYKKASKMSNKEIELENKNIYLLQKYKFIYSGLPNKSKKYFLNKPIEEIEKLLEKHGTFSNVLFIKNYKEDQKTFYFKEKTLVCRKCGNEFDLLKQIKHRVRTDYNPCLNCYPPMEDSKPFSRSEKEVMCYVEKIYDGEILGNNRKILKNRTELDIFLKDLNIGIEYNGVYWHRPEKDLIKFKRCKEFGISLVVIWEEFWRTKRNVVKHLLKLKIGVLEKIKGKEIVEINREAAIDFLKNTSLYEISNKTKFMGIFSGKGKLIGVIEIDGNKIVNFGSLTSLEEFIKLLPKGFEILDQNEWSFFENFKEVGKIRGKFEYFQGVKYKTLGKTIRKIL